jgi:hypothetical protein
MSTVLWSNLLINGLVESDQSDHYALYKHADKLEQLAQKWGLPSFQSACDTTDLQFNMCDDEELPEGITSTNEIMATKGQWLTLADGIRMLEGLLANIRKDKVRFGMLSNQHDEVVEELEEVLRFAKSGEGRAQKFNFSVVM